LVLFFLSKHIRSTLKDQMEEKAQINKNEQERKNLDCKFIIEKDRQDLEQQKQKEKQRAALLLKVTTRNKEVQKRYTYRIIHS